jgi:hypothetical protein
MTASEHNVGERPKWRRDLILVSALVILAVGGIFYGFSETLSRSNEAALKNCRDLNQSKKQQRRSVTRAIAAAKDAIGETKASDPTLFPDIPPAKFHHLLHKSVKQQRQSNADRRKDFLRLHGVDCTVRFPPWLLDV